MIDLDETGKLALGTQDLCEFFFSNCVIVLSGESPII